MQSSWIGRSQGSQVQFQAVLDADATQPIPLTVFTTRVDTLFGVSFVSMAPDSIGVEALLLMSPQPNALLSTPTSLRCEP